MTGKIKGDPAGSPFFIHTVPVSSRGQIRSALPGSARAMVIVP